MLDYEHQKNYDALDQATTFGIQRNLVFLEGAITYQMESDDWARPYHVTELLNDVLDGITLAQTIGASVDEFDDYKGAYLQLKNHLMKLKHEYWLPEATITELEREQFERLAGQLQAADWRIDVSYSSGLEEFESKVERLISHQWGGSVE